MGMRAQGTRGFTLTELTIVLLIGVLFFIMISALKGNYRALDSLAYSVRSMFYTARLRAISTGRGQGIFFCADGVISLYDSAGAYSVTRKNIDQGANKLVYRIAIAAFADLEYGFTGVGANDPTDPDLNIPDTDKPIKMGHGGIMNIKPWGGVTNGSVYIRDSRGEYMLCLRTAFAYTRFFAYIHNPYSGRWRRLF